MSNIIKTLLAENTNVAVTISVSELREANTQLIRDVMAEMEKSIQNKDELLTKAQVREKLDVTDSTLWRWEKERYLTPKRIGGRVYYRLADVLWIQKGGEQ